MCILIDLGVDTDRKNRKTKHFSSIEKNAWSNGGVSLKKRPKWVDAMENYHSFWDIGLQLTWVMHISLFSLHFSHWKEEFKILNKTKLKNIG